MAEHRPFPPSPRRLALARASGLTAVSPLLVGAAALVGAAVALVGLGRAAAAQLGRWVVGAVNASDGSAVASASSTVSPVPAASATSSSAELARGVDLAAGATSSTAELARNVDLAAGATSSTTEVVHELDAATNLPSSPAELGAVLHLGAAARAVLELALPLLGAAAIAAFVIHLAQTRALWLPLRKIPGAPSMPRHLGSRALFDTAGACVIGGVALAWLWLTAPQLANLVQSPAAAGLAIATFVIALAIACVALGVLDALLRYSQLASALAMTREEKREDDRLAAADPRWRAQRLAVLRGPSITDAVARAAVVLVGDDTAVAIDWDATRQPVPLRTATGRRTRATQLIALARRHRVPMHRDAELAAALVGADGPVPDTHWARLAEIIAARTT